MYAFMCRDIQSHKSGDGLIMITSTYVCMYVIIIKLGSAIHLGECCSFCKQKAGPIVGTLSIKVTLLSKV
jgi:hypothetical protein